MSTLNIHLLEREIRGAFAATETSGSTWASMSMTSKGPAGRPRHHRRGQGPHRQIGTQAAARRHVAGRAPVRGGPENGRDPPRPPQAARRRHPARARPGAAGRRRRRPGAPAERQAATTCSSPCRSTTSPPSWPATPSTDARHARHRGLVPGDPRPRQQEPVQPRRQQPARSPARRPDHRLGHLRDPHGRRRGGTDRRQGARRSHAAHGQRDAGRPQTSPVRSAASTSRSSPWRSSSRARPPSFSSPRGMWPRATTLCKKSSAPRKPGMLDAQLNENDKHNVTAKVDFEVRRGEEAAILKALTGAGEVLSRKPHPRPGDRKRRGQQGPPPGEPGEHRQQPGRGRRCSCGCHARRAGELPQRCTRPWASSTAGSSTPGST